jgi:bifunctional enzyme CysN/CysC
MRQLQWSERSETAISDETCMTGTDLKSPIWNGEVVRVLTCGSVDAGKSTLIGRLLFDLDLVADDQMMALERDTRRTGFAQEGVDFSLLLDGLEVEQQQGITIDVAYRYIRTSNRKLIIADTPGHEQYTRNMACGASVSDVAIILVDAQKGVLAQTRRHALIASLFGVRHAILLVNKLDTVDFSEAAFEAITQTFAEFAAGLEFGSVGSIPIAALQGDNIVKRTTRMPWYRGQTLIEYLEAIDVSSNRIARPMRLPVQSVCRTEAGARAVAGTICSGTLRIGDLIAVSGTQTETRVARLLDPSGDRQFAQAGDAVMVLLTEELDLSRGDLLYALDDRPVFADQFSGRLLWMGDEHLVPERSYLLKIATRTVPVLITKIKHQIDVDTGAHIARTSLRLNEIAECNFSVSVPISLDSFARCPETACFILIDRITNATVGAGTIMFALRRASNIHPHQFEIDKNARAVAKGQEPVVIWLTGLPGSGKSTIGDLVERKLHAMGRHTYLIDGDNVRGGLSRDLGFTEPDRVENIRRVAELARLFVDAGLIVIVALISPYRADRRQARELIGPGEFIEAFVDTPIAVCRERDPKGLYAKADQGQLSNMTGVDQPYEAPEHPEIRLSTVDASPDELADQIIDFLRERLANAGRVAS